MHEAGKSQAQIDDYLKLAKFTMTSIIHCHNRQPENPLRPTKRAGWPLKLDNLSRRLFIRSIEQNRCDDLKALGTPSKSGQAFFPATVRKYLKADGYFVFKARKKPFLSSKN